MRITDETPIYPDPPAGTGVEIFPGEINEVETDWYQTDIDELKSQLDHANLRYREYSLMRKAIGFESGLLVGLLIWGGTEAMKVLAAWLPARQGRRVRIKFKDGTEIEASSIKELEQVRDRFLPSAKEDDVGD